MKVFMSVGSSLLEKVESRYIQGTESLKREFSDNMVSPGTMRELEFLPDLSGITQDWINDDIDGITDFCVDYFRRCSENYIAKNITWRKFGKNDWLADEIASLFLYYYDGNRIRKPSEVVLICTEYPPNILCAKMLREVFFRMEIFGGIKPEIVIFGMNEYYPEKWVAGLSELHQFFNAADPEKWVIIRTGGHTEFSAELKLISHMKQIKSFFLYERSVSLIPYP